jgi:S1-C subfamily serine protease
MKRIIVTLPVLAGAIAGAIVALAISAGHSSKTVTETVVSAGSASAAASVPTSTASSASSAGGTSSTGALTVNQIYKKDSAGVVDILVTSDTTSSSSSSSGSGGGLFGLGGGSTTQEQEDEGAGVVYDAKGDIITDEHVVAGTHAKIEVRFQDGVVAPATIVGTPDASTDVAVIHVKVAQSQLHPITFADSSTAQVGDPVVAIGSPFSLPETVTQGIVSAVGRPITAPNNFTITGAIQTDAAINPGNSGGPLLDSTGEVLGLNDQIQTSSGDSAGVGFATPGNTDVKVANEMIAGKSVQHAYVGLCVQDATTGVGAEIAPSAATSSASGSSCTTPIAAGSPAAQAGLKAGEVITAVNGTKITSSDDFVQVLGNFAPGNVVTFTVKQGGTVRNIKVKLGNRPATVPSGG